MDKYIIFGLVSIIGSVLTKNNIFLPQKSPKELQNKKTKILKSACVCRMSCMEDPKCTAASWKPFGDAIQCTTTEDESLKIEESTSESIFCKKKSACKSYFFEKVPSDIKITIKNGKAYISLGVKRSTWQEAFDECQKREGFSLVMPKTLEEYTYILEVHDKEGQKEIFMNIARLFEEDVYHFGDGTLYAESGLPTINENDPFPKGVHAYNNGIYDITKNIARDSVTLCEFSLE